MPKGGNNTFFMKADGPITSGHMKNRLFWITFSLIILSVLILTFLRIFVFKDYFVVDEVQCDAASEECFVRTPEELCLESEDPNCVLESEVEHYKIIYKKAYTIQTCLYQAGTENLCQLSCDANVDETECYYEYCTDNCDGN